MGTARNADWSLLKRPDSALVCETHFDIYLVGLVQLKLLAHLILAFRL